jgi:23S rRNA (cytosine1962-C5)-methyltransferase
VLLRNDAPSRALEGLESYREVAHGRLPDTIDYEEHGTRFEIDLEGGQKTGWYFDHRRNRARFLRHVGGRRVLDLFSYTGAWGIEAAVAGASEVLCVDSSPAAVAQVAHHARLNGVDRRVAAERADVFQCLRDLRAGGRRFDVIVADPPAFIRRKKDAAKGLEAYRRLNGLAMQLLADGGLLVSASCSFHLGREKLLEILARVAGGVRRRAIVLEEGGQDADHPIHPGLPESGYLKAFFVHVTD